MDEKTLLSYSSVKEVLDNCFEKKTLLELFPDAKEISYGSWSENSNELEIVLENGSVETIEFLLYRESLTKDGKVREDNDPNLGIDYAGRYTLQAFFVDGGDTFPICLDCGLEIN